MGKQPTLPCTRWGCGHSKSNHDDPLMEGMCDAPGCQCLGYTTKRAAGSAPHVAQPRPEPKAPVRTLVQARQKLAEASVQEVTDQTWPGNHGERLDHDPRHGMIDKDIQEHVAEMRPESVAQRVAIENSLQGSRDRGRVILGVAPVPESGTLDPAPAPSAPTPVAATEKERCSSTCGHCGKRCGGLPGHDDKHFRRGRSGHTWHDVAPRPESEPSALPVLDLEAHKAKVDEVAAGIAQELAVDEPEQVRGLDTPRTAEIAVVEGDASAQANWGNAVDVRLAGTWTPPVEPEVLTPVETPGPSSTPVEKPVDERYVLAHRKHPDGTRRCPHCAEMVEVEKFSPSKTTFDGLSGWCKRCTNDRKHPMTLGRAIRNRARHRASAELIALHRDEFRELYERMVEEATAEADLLQDDEAAKEIYGEEEHVRLRPGRRNDGETPADRIDVARCPDCIRFHDQNHTCEVCGSTPEHRQVTQSAWATTQARLRERREAQ